MAQISGPGTLTGSIIGSNVLSGIGAGGGGVGIANAASIANAAVYPSEQRAYARETTTLIARYEKCENGWIVQVAQHEGDRYKRFIAETLEDAHKQVSAYIVAERLER